jgi:ketosteroid isomerase-like protein
MSQDEAEILLRLTEAFNRRDFDDGLQYMDADVELYPGVLAPDQDTRFVGHRGVREFLRGATEVRESVTVEREEIVEAAGSRFLVVDRWTFRGRDGIEVERELPTLYTFRNGLIVRIDGFVDRAEAFEAAGLGDR